MKLLNTLPFKKFENKFSEEKSTNGKSIGGGGLQAIKI